MHEIAVSKSANKEFQKIDKSNPAIGEEISIFLFETLSTAQNPCTLPNTKKLQDYGDNRYRWRLGDYRTEFIK